jgi:hypothetical protein
MIWTIAFGVVLGLSMFFVLPKILSSVLFWKIIGYGVGFISVVAIVLFVRQSLNTPQTQTASKLPIQSEVVKETPPSVLPQTSGSHCGDYRHKPSNILASEWTNYSCSVGANCFSWSTYTVVKENGCPGLQQCCPPKPVVVQTNTPMRSVRVVNDPSVINVIATAADRERYRQDVGAGRPLN